MRYSLEHADADNPNKSSHIDAAASLSHLVSSSANLHIQATQVSENHKREHVKLSNTSCQGGGGTARVLQGYLDKGSLDTRRKSKDYIPPIPEVKKAIPGIEKDVLSTKVINKKSKFAVTKNGVTAEAKAKTTVDLGNRELTSVTKQKIISEEISEKVRDHQNDELNRKVIHHHQHGKLRLLTVADLKCFLGARKAKVGGTKEVLVQRVTELLG